MKLFLHAHATHPEWPTALALAAAQIEAQRQLDDHVQEPTLGWIYLTDHFAGAADELLAELQRRWPGVAWVGAVDFSTSASASGAKRITVTASYNGAPVATATAVRTDEVWTP